jgi:hypothetical protein
MALVDSAKDSWAFLMDSAVDSWAFLIKSNMCREVVVLQDCLDERR